MTTATQDALSSNPGGLLAPGFRFHPTDEELVSYYLKRKLSGRPLRIDAIADVDVYASEPWDLPAMSRLRSRDMEWYFFSTLDRKYSNRSRTNRATRDGYWKTTGKDRSVFHRSVVDGMKKTLVFHLGRAPKGQRTNWVMHEYRLHHDSDEAEDGYVVCRIFQKSGSGPQNGAQYGAPFVEEEWEEDDQLYVEPPKEEEPVAVAANEYVQLNDFVQKQDTDNQRENSVLFALGANVQDGGTNSEDPANLLEEMFDVTGYVNDLEVQDDPTLIYNQGENTGSCQQSQSPDQNDGYLELKDILGNESMSYPSNGNSSVCSQRMLNDKILVHGANESLISQEMDAAAFFENLNVTADPYELGQMCLPVEGDFNLPTDGSPNLVAGSYNSAQPSEYNMVFYDAPSQDLYEDGIFMNDNQLQFSPIAAELDDLMAYFDATDNNLQYVQNFSENVEFGSSNVARSNSAPEVEYNSNPLLKATPQVLGANVEGAGSSSTRPAEAYNKLGNKNASVIATADAQNTGSWNKSLKKHMVNILGSINAPPAMAEDLGKQRAIQFVSSTRSSSSISVSAGMIHVHGAVGSAEHWTLQKNRDMGFLLPYGMADNEVVGKSVCFESITKVQGGAMSTMLRGGLYLFGIYMLIIAITFKVGVCIYSK